jgi:histidine triad (HIT) family protein
VIVTNGGGIAVQVEDCVFCRIVRGEMKSWTVYEDDHVQAFLDINPVSEGHTLIIPKEHYETMYDVPASTLEKIIVVAKTLAQAYERRLGVTAVNVLHASGKAAQQSVFHFHLHLVPRHVNDGLNLWYPPRPRRRPNLDALLSKIGRL